MITHDNNATTWRDLVDQLTPSQVEHAEHFESVARSDPEEVAAMLLDEARNHARQNLNDQLTFGHLPVPEGATRLFHWEQDHEGNWEREFSGTHREHGMFEVGISGAQLPDGSCRRQANIYCKDIGPQSDFTAEDLRTIARLAVEAADEMDRLNG